MPDRRTLRRENKAVTSDEEFALAERSDDLFVGALGKTLDRAMLQLGLILGSICAIAATLVVLAT